MINLAQSSCKFWVITKTLFWVCLRIFFILLEFHDILEYKDLDPQTLKGLEVVFDYDKR